MSASGIAVLHGRPGVSFYDGVDGRDLVTCRDCSLPADALFGDHGGECVDYVKHPAPSTGLGIVRAYALKNRHFSMNELRQLFIAAGIRKSSRAAALTGACKRGWIEADGFVRSTDAATKGHNIQTYRSLIFDTRPRRTKDGRL